ncbi:oxygenase MpaB family protein [Catellatospora sp. NPDC049133]|uniref:oxygenase MpaB family protein n=1 Tax=Catellatospora sp. NPDC049133 TaxID=3155499 RepID=UPI0033E2A699
MREQQPPHAAYRRLALFDMPEDVKIGMNLALYRTWGIPAIAAVLHQTGEIVRHTQRRSDDTGLIMYLLIYHGFEHPTSEKVLRRLNAMHHRLPISPEDYLYALASLMVVPTRWIARWGPRPLNAQERQGTFDFYAELGRRMGVQNIPASYDDVESWLDSFEVEHLRPSAQAAALLRAARGMLVDRFPPAARPVARRLVDALLDPPLREALGVPEPSMAAKATVRLLLSARAARARRRPPRTEPSFHPDGPVRSYPHGYDPDRLGPAYLNS